MLSLNHVYSSNYHRRTLFFKLLLLLLALVICWSTEWKGALAATPGHLVTRFTFTGINSVAATTALTNSTTITPAQPISGDTVSSQAVCPAADLSETADYQNIIVEKLWQTTAGMVGAWPTGLPLSQRVNLLLLGSDSRPGEKFGHTDTIILATLDPAAKTAGLFSIPRDLWVTIPGYGENRINMAYRLGEVKGQPGDGIPLLMETIEANLGIPIDFYALVNFEGFKQIVDELGGIEVCAPETIDAAAYYGYTPASINYEEYYSVVPADEGSSADANLDNQSADDTSLVDLDSNYHFLYIEAGLHTLNGEAALRYARSRASVTADFARVQRQQAVLWAIRSKALQAGAIFKLPQLWAELNQSVVTNLTLGDILQLAQVAAQIEPANIQTAAISHDQTVSYKTKSGASVLLPKRAEIRTLVEHIFGPVNPTAEPTQAEIEAGLTPAAPTTIAQAEVK